MFPPRLTNLPAMDRASTGKMGWKKGNQQSVVFDYPIEQ